MDKNATLYFQSACDLKLVSRVFEPIAGFAIHLGKRVLYFRGGDTPFNNASSIGIARNKYCTNKVLAAAGFPVPKATVVSRRQFEQGMLQHLIRDLRFPMVIKPTNDSSLGRDVLCNLSTLPQLEHFMHGHFARHDSLSIEEFHAGLKAYRVLVFCDQVIGVVQRFPAHVVGDGVHSIQELIELQNREREPLRAMVAMGPLQVDAEYLIRLNELNLTLSSVPADTETVVLCYTCNSSRGGTMTSLGKQICKANARLCIGAAKVLGLSLVGFDVLCEDILLPINASRGVIVEANYNPDLTIHEYPMAGIQTRVSKTILKRLIMRYPLAYLSTLVMRRSDE